MKKLMFYIVMICAGIYISGCETDTERCLKQGYNIEQCNQQKIANTQAQAMQNSNTNSALLGAAAGAAATHFLSNRNSQPQQVMVQPTQPQTIINKTYNITPQTNTTPSVATPKFGSQSIPQVTQPKQVFKPVVTNPKPSTSRFDLKKK